MPTDCHEHGPKERAIAKARHHGAQLVKDGLYVEALRLIDAGMNVARELDRKRELSFLSELSVKARLLLVEELNTVGRASEAIRVCIAGLKLLPGEPALQGAVDDTVPKVLAAEEFLDVASTALALGDLDDAHSSLTQALTLDVASVRLGPLLEAAADIADRQGESDMADSLLHEASALGHFDRRMQQQMLAGQDEGSEHEGDANVLDEVGALRCLSPSKREEEGADAAGVAAGVPSQAETTRTKAQAAAVPAPAREPARQLEEPAREQQRVPVDVVDQEILTPWTD